jgi:copper(I)-binding protein
MFLVLVVVILSACAAPTSAPAADTADCSNLSAAGQKIKIEKSWARATEGGQIASSAGHTMGGMKMPNSINTAAFLVIHNCAVQSDTLIKAASNLDGITTLMNFEMKDGKPIMMNVDQIDIPAGKKVELKSGGYHVMFTNLKQGLKPGDRVELTLSFKNARDISITLPVENPE